MNNFYVSFISPENTYYTKKVEEADSDDDFGDFGSVQSPVQQVSVLHSRIEKVEHYINFLKNILILF